MPRLARHRTAERPYGEAAAALGLGLGEKLPPSQPVLALPGKAPPGDEPAEPADGVTFF